jgi:gliding motility-associated lipoprotein GldH
MKLRSVLAVFALVAFLTFSSCSRYYREFQPLQGMIWEKSNVVKFKVNIEDNTKGYDLIIWLRHHAEAPISEIPLRFKITAPSGKTVLEADVDQKLRNDDNTLVGEAAGDYCDNEMKVKENFKFEEKGEHTFEIALDSQDPKVGNIMQVGLILDLKK